MATATGIADKSGLYCHVCGKMLSPEDIAGKLGEIVFCDICVESTAYMKCLAGEHAKNRHAMVLRIKPHKQSGTRVWLPVLGAAIIAVQVAVLFFFTPALPLNRHAAVDGSRVPMTNDLGLCLEHMWLQVRALEHYKLDHGVYPESLDDLVPQYLEEPFLHPVTGATYIYSRDGAFYLLETPNPEIHDIKALTCDGRGGPPRIWLGERR